MSEGINWFVLGPTLACIGMLWLAFMSSGRSL